MKNNSHCLSRVGVIIILTLFISNTVMAQVPHDFNYQAVLRDSTGYIMQNRNVTMKFTIRQGTPTGTAVYEETQPATTNDYGLINLKIGQGGAAIGAFQSIQWGTNNFFLQVWVDKGSGYINLGTTPFSSVPYALVADTVLHGGGGLSSVNHDATLSGNGISPLGIAQQGATNGQSLKWNGTAWLPANDNDAQTLNITGNSLSISGGNVVTLPTGSGTGTVTSIATGTGLIGGPVTTSGTISLVNTGVAANAYGNSSNYPTFTVNAQGQLTSAGTQPLPTSLAPNGSAGGDLNGTYPNPTVAKIQNISISSTAPTSGQVLTYNGINWTPTTPSSSNGANQALSNLTSPTSVSQSLIPIISNAWDLGSSSLLWNTLWLSGGLHMNISANIHGIDINHNGTSGQPLKAITNSNSNSQTTALVQTYGTGRAMEIDNMNSGNSSPVIYIGNSGTGKFIDAQGGAYLSNGGTWMNASDENLKEKFEAINDKVILSKIDELNITKWNYKSEGENVKHIGPMAQQFYQLFRTGADNVSISTIDPAGIALVGIKELHKELIEQQTMIEELKKLVAILQAKLDKIQGNK